MSESGEPHRTSSAPIMAALVIVVVVIIGVVLLSVLRPADRNVTESDRVGSALVGYIDARKSGDAARIADTLCTPSTSQPLASEGNDLDLKTIDGVTVDGEAATTNITVEVDGSEINAAVDFRKVGEDWKVCS